MYLKKNIIYVFLIIFPTILFAWPPMFGPEWEFTNAAVERESYSPDKASHDLFLAIVEKCKKTKACHGDLDQQRITFKNGYWINISADPGTIEVQAKPSTTEEFKKVKDLVQKYLFDVAKKEGFLPNSKKWGAGQIHIDRVTSGMTESGQLFRNFVVDFSNHWEIGAGVMEYDNNNAKVAALLSKDTKIKLRGVLLPEINYNNSSLLNKNLNEILHDRYVALNLQNEHTLEVRSLRMQESADDYLKMTTLLEARINWLRTQKGNIPLQSWQVKYDDALMARMFQAYVKEAGLSWDDYAPMLPKEYRKEEKIKYHSLDPVDQIKEVEQFKKAMLEEFSDAKHFVNSELTGLVPSLSDEIRIPVVENVAKGILSTLYDTHPTDSVFDKNIFRIGQLLADSRVDDNIVVKALLKLGEDPNLSYYPRTFMSKKIHEYLKTGAGGVLGPDDLRRILQLSYNMVNTELPQYILPKILELKTPELLEVMLNSQGQELGQIAKVFNERPDLSNKMQKILSANINKFLIICNDPIVRDPKTKFEILKHLSIHASAEEKLKVHKLFIKNLDSAHTFQAAMDALLYLRPLPKESMALLKKRFNKKDDRFYPLFRDFSPCSNIFE